MLQSVTRLVGKEPLDKAVITAVFTKDETGKWNYLIGKCEFYNEQESIEEIYSDIAFIRKSITDFDLKEFVDSLGRDGYGISVNMPPIVKADKNSISWSEEVVPSHATLSGYPERKYSGKIVSNAQFNAGLLLGYDLSNPLAL